MSLKLLVHEPLSSFGMGAKELGFSGTHFFFCWYKSTTTDAEGAVLFYLQTFSVLNLLALLVQKYKY